MALIVSSRLDSLTDRVRLRPVSWDGYARAGLLSQGDVALVQKAQTANLDDDETAQEHASLYVRLLEKLNRNEARAYVLVLVGDLLKDDKRLSLISPAAASLLNLLTTTSDEFIRLKSAAILASLPDLPQDILSSALTHLAKLIGFAPPVSSSESTASSDSGDPDREIQLVALQCVCALFRRSPARQEAWKREEKTGQRSEEANGRTPEQDEQVKVIFPLVQLLRQVVDVASSSSASSSSGRSTPMHGSSTPNASVGQGTQAQMAYYVGFAFWLLSFERDFCEGINGKYGLLIPLLADLARTAIKEKVVRVVLATYRNFTSFAPKETLPAMLAARVQPYLQNLASQRKWSDQEVKDDIEFLIDELKGAKQRMSTYDEYTSELKSGRLRWTPPHENVEFWKENAGKLNDKDNEAVKSLLNLLVSSKDSTTLAVALNDLGRYVEYCDSGKKTLDKLGGKSRIMGLLNHADADVKYRALIATQRLVSQPWSA